MVYYPKTYEEVRLFQYPKEIADAYEKLPYPPRAKIADVDKFLVENFAPIKWGTEWPAAADKGAITPSQKLYGIYEFLAESMAELFVGDVTKHQYDITLKSIREDANSKENLALCDKMGLTELKESYREGAKGSSYLLLFSSDDVILDGFVFTNCPPPLKIYCPIVFFSGMKPPNLNTFAKSGYVKYLIEIGYLKV